MACNHKTTMALVVVVVATLSVSSASDEEEALVSLLRSDPRAAAMAAAAAVADSGTPTGTGTGTGSATGSGSMVWEATQPDPRWYLITEAEALQDSALAGRRERQAALAGSGSGHRSALSTPSQSLEASSEEERRRVGAGAGEHKRSGPSLSIVNPLEVLRQRVLLEIARRRYKQSEGQIQANRDLLRVIGKRGRSDALASNALIPSLEAASDSDLLEAAAAIDSLSATRRIPSWWQ